MPVILTFGDSNTHGTMPMPDIDFSGRFSRSERWPGVMVRALGPDWHLIEEGHPGRTTLHDDPLEGLHKNGLALLPAVLESHLPLDVIALMLGTNDLKARFAVTPEDIARSCEKLILFIRAAGAGADGGTPKVLLIAPPPILETGDLEGMFRGGAVKSAQFGRLYAETARRTGAGFLNAGSVITSSSIDGIHFDAVEHAKLCKAAAASVIQMMR